jgi:glycosyltransferase involved in cell wall biosynthesis
MQLPPVPATSTDAPVADRAGQGAEPPQATFVILAFNQAAYIAEALHAALAQSYSPLEILVSDDCSSDDTPGIIRTIAANYTGPHKLVLNFNESNLGIGAHVNKVFQLARGQLLVLAAGDDVSAGNRVERMVAAWLRHGRRPSAIYCEANAIDALGQPCGHFDTALAGIARLPERLISYSNRRKLLLLGACAAYTPQVQAAFGPLDPRLGVEDIPLTVRASLLGGVECIDERLVDYRINVSVWLPRKLAGEDFDRHRQRMAHRIRANYRVSRQLLADARKSGAARAIEAASARDVATTFAMGVCSSGRFSLPKCCRTLVRTPHWRAALWPSVLFALPAFHRWVFHLNRRAKRQ